MVSPTHLESLVQRVQAHAPAFGRAAPDLSALCARARAADYRGVLQNTRLVVETLLRSIMASKSQTPGKQTLEQLASKMQADLPTHVAVHVRTIQAWGTVGAHDQGEGLFAGGLEVTDQEATSALTALVAILDWYRGAHLAPEPPAPAAAPKRGGVVLLAAAVAAVIAAAGALAFVTLRGEGPGAPPPAAAPKPLDYGPLDALYAARELPRPAESCRTESPELLARLTAAAALLEGGEPGGRRPQDAQAVAQLDAVEEAERTLGEYWLLVALARQFEGAPDEEVLAALAQGVTHCDEMTELYNMQGKLLFKAGDLRGAIKAFKRAVATGEGYGAPRLNLALTYVEAKDLPRAKAAFDELIASLPGYAPGYRGRGAYFLGQGDAAAAVGDLKQAVSRDDADGLAHLLLGQAARAAGDAATAEAAFCRAKALGQAGAECP